MVTKKKRSNSLFLCHNGYGDNMLEEYGKVMKVFIPKQYKNDILLDVMDRTNVGFEILVNGKIKEFIFNADKNTGSIKKEDYVIIRRQTISNKEFVDIEKIEEGINE